MAETEPNAHLLVRFFGLNQMVCVYLSYLLPCKIKGLLKTVSVLTNKKDAMKEQKKYQLQVLMKNYENLLKLCNENIG